MSQAASKSVSAANPEAGRVSPAYGRLMSWIGRRDFRSPVADLNGKTVLVTGGTGSFGKAFISQVIAEFKPKRLIVFSRDELKQFEMAQQFPQDKYPFMRFFIGDVRSRDRLEMAMRDVDYVVHAAAMKQVPIAEYNPLECVHTNILGAENIVHAALARGVKKVLALSTDKAANPVNLYGATKLASDKIFVAANHLAGAEGTRFSVVRYGNVIGSRGSVVPMFEKMIADGVEDLPITDDRMTRFWITLPQGVNLVLSSIALMKGGEIYVPKIPSLKMTELATMMAPGMKQRIIGIRPGEKLHEVMIPEDISRQTVELTDRYVIVPDWGTLRAHYLGEGGTQVTDGFCYSSDKNVEALDARGLQSLLAGAFP